MAENQKICISIFSLLIAFTCIHSSIVYYRSKKNVSLYAFLFNQLLLALWLYFGMREKMSSSLDELLVNVRFTLPFSLMMGPSWIFYAYHYRNEEKNYSFDKRTLLFFLPTLILLMPLYIPPLYHLIIVDKTFGYASKTVWGPLFQVNYAITMGMIVIAFISIIKEAFQKTKKLRVIWMYGLAVMVPSLINVLSLLDIMASPGFDLTPVAYYFFSLITAFLIIRYQFLEIIPRNLHNLILTLSDGIIIVNKNGEIISHNLTAQELFSNYFNQMKDKKFTTFLSLISPQHDFRFEDFDDLDDSDEIIYTNGQGRRVSLLVTMGKVAGTLQKNALKIYAFKDITNYQEKVIDAERNRVSYDLHDRLGNDLNAIRNNLELALEHTSIDMGIHNSIQTSYERSTMAFLELKKIVDNLNSDTHESDDLKTILAHFFDKVALDGLEVDFVCHRLETIILDKMLTKDLVLICQEAVTNAMVHGKAKKITVSIKREDPYLTLYIIDDGNGAKDIVKGHGLRSMERRVEAHRGKLSYGSPSIGGFNIRIDLPL